ncbi:hypothetical protein [Rubrivirga sp.]|uniref:hypothetical protein n=1 Tax=Rubrivirga sp. TaxID=1885344 RepID=UPI003C76C621
MLRLPTLFALLIVASGCEGEISIGNDPQTFDQLVDNLVIELVGPDADATALDCPGLEGDAPGEYTCTSTVDGQDVTWAMTVSALTAVDGGDSTAVGLVPDYGSESAGAEWALKRSFRTTYDMELASISCPDGDAPDYTAVCQANYDGKSFDVQFDKKPDGTFVYVPTGVGFRQNTEAAIANGLEQGTGLATSVTCETPTMWEIEIGQEFACDVRATETGEQAEVRLVMTDMVGNFDWNVVVES